MLAPAPQIAERDGITDGLVTVLSTVEPCTSFQVLRNDKERCLDVARARRKCLHLY